MHQKTNQGSSKAAKNSWISGTFPQVSFPVILQRNSASLGSRDGSPHGLIMNLKMENKEQEETKRDEKAEVSSAHRPRKGAGEEATFEDDTNSFRIFCVFLDFKKRRRNSEQ